MLRIAGLEIPERSFGGYIFDCDGTLADSMPLHHRAWRAALGAYGAPIDFTWELFVRRAGKTLERTVEELNLEFGSKLDPNAVAARQRSEYAAGLRDVRPVPAVLELLRAVAGRYPVSVASGGDAPTVRKTLEYIGVLEHFPIIVTAFEVAHGKPAPDLFLLAAERMGVPPSDCLVIEDSLLGIEAAERAGMGWVLVPVSPPAAVLP